jgi:hypothetical protein
MALIKCSECGKEISDKATSCIGCGAPVVAASQPIPTSSGDAESCDKLDADLREQQMFFPRSWETVIFDKELGSYIKSALNVDTGDITLTDRRIVFCGKMGSYTKLAILGGLAAFTDAFKPKIHFQIILKDITKLELGKHGFAKTFFATTKDGKQYKFQVRKYDKWIDYLTGAGIKVEGT